MIFDCGCCEARPKEQSCKAYGTRWRNYISINEQGIPLKILMKCRDCGRMRHFDLNGKTNPSIIQYMGKEEDMEME